MKWKIGTISLIIRIYFLVLLFLTVFRLILFFSGLERIDFNIEPIINILSAFVIGLRFDIVIIGYIIFIPTLILLILDLFNKKNKIIQKLAFYWTFILFGIAFMISAADIPYFNQFFSRFSIGAFEWIDSFDFVIKMIIEEPKYFIFIILWIVVMFVFFKLLRRLFYRNYSTTIRNIIVKTFISIVFLGIVFIGIRGRVEKKSPIRVGTAFFCSNPFLNQLGLNPTFTFIHSYIASLKEKNKPINLIEEEIAYKNVREYLSRADFIDSVSIDRKIVPDSISNKKLNVVVIIMESMSAAKMTRYGNKDNLTPFLDSLSYNSYYFNSIYTAGEHTYNGIFSTLFSYPALYRQHPLKKMNKYHGFATSLKKLGYSTTYFTTHDGQFDNVEGFLRANDFDNIYSQIDYPIEEIKTTLGVPDDYLFRFSIPVIDKLSADNKPFFVTFMTASDHGPYYVPEYYKPHTKEVRKQTVEYADWSLRKFIDIASHKSWFDSTIFVFVADHGAAINVEYDIPLNYHHSPLIIFAPKLLKPKQFNDIGGQIDIYPTVMGLLHQPYINTTLGVDLINSSRPYILINGDDKVAALDNEFLMILKKDNSKSLYKYKTLDKKNYLIENPDKVKEMDKYLRSNMQVFQSIFSQNHN